MKKYMFTLEELKTIEKIIKNPMGFNIEFAIKVVEGMRKYKKPDQQTNRQICD
jgi:hypothetical protein